MKRYYNIHKVEIPNFIAIDLIEKGKVVGGYIVLINGIAKEGIIEYLKKEGYTEYEKADHPN